jgi:hypothetical protein
MGKYKAVIIFGISCLLVMSLVKISNAQYDFGNSGNFEFHKREFNWGLRYKTDNEREETRTDFTRDYEELKTGEVKLQLNNRLWNYLDDKQEQVEFNIETGPLWGNGNWIDSSSVENVEADHKISGLRTNASASYNSRFYYNKKNYTLVQINGWARYDIYSQNSSGISTDSDNFVTDFDEKTKEDKFRFNVNARAGWGIGKLKPMNHFMVADYFLKKYYAKNNLSQTEIIKFANEISKIKQRRNIATGHDTDVETQQMQEFLNQKMFMIPVTSLEEEWKTGEFSPRFDGNRVEFGPFFTYYNREPDFIYGGYLLFNNAKYCNVHWNRNFSAGINYNAYKKQDWILAELNIGWSYYIKLKSQIDFGFKYIPGIVLNESENMGKLNNGFIPYLGYFTQIDSKSRIDIKLSYRFSEDEKLMLSGPEFSVSVFRSRY